MPASPLDSALYRDLMYDREVASLFTDSAEIRAMLLVEGALARVQGRLGMIPEISAAAIHRAASEVLIDPGQLAEATGRNAVPVPALVAAFRTAMEAPEHAQYVHWGATSQDIMDTAQTLRLRQVLALFETRLTALTAALADLAGTHAESPMAGRTWGQNATVTSFGAVVASWGRPLLRHAARLGAVRDDVLVVSLSGAAGTLSAMGEDGPRVRAALADELKLSDPGSSWHSERDGIAALGNWCAGLTGSLAKMAEDILAMTQTGIAELRLSGAGGSSTMPQKQNPVAPSLILALARLTAGLSATLTSATAHRQQRDGAAWMTEWLTLPQIAQATGQALATATGLATTLAPDTEAMARNIDSTGLGLIHAEALSFALAAHMPRPEAQAAVKALCREAMDKATPLSALATRDWPDLDLADCFDPTSQMGTAPTEARDFARHATKAPSSG